MNIDCMDYIRSALYNAIASGLTLEDVAQMSCYAKTPQDFDEAVNVLTTATPQSKGAAWTPQGWVAIE